SVYFRLYCYGAKLPSPKNENPENLETMCGSGNGQRDVGMRHWDASRWRPIENKDGAGLPRREEKERGFQESHGKVRFARRSFGRNNSHKQRGVGTARRGRRERRNSLRTECGQIFCAGFEHEVVR